MLILAHRGVRSREASENTLEAFRAAQTLGADGIECDLRLSRDGEIVIVHDRNLHRVAGDAHQVKELTAQELTEVQLRNGGKIPTLHDLTSSIHAPLFLDFEIKSLDALEPLIAKLKTSTGLRERTIISSFFLHAIERIRKEFPEMRTILLISRWPLPLRLKRFQARLSRLRPWAVGMSLRRSNRRRITSLHRMGFAVAIWDERGALSEARKIVQLKIDVAIVRRVDEARRHLPHR